jgi:hypothetical protein
MVHQRKKALLEGGNGRPQPCGAGGGCRSGQAVHAKNGELTVERHFFGTRAASVSRQEREPMIQPDHPTLSIVKQCRLASIGHSTFYHVPRGESAENFRLMVEIDRQLLETPFYHHAGSPPDAADGMPIYRRPRTSSPAKGHKLYP